MALYTSHLPIRKSKSRLYIESGRCYRAFLKIQAYIFKGSMSQKSNNSFLSSLTTFLLSTFVCSLKSIWISTLLFCFSIRLHDLHLIISASYQWSIHGVRSLQNSDYGRLRLTLFQENEVKEALDFARQRAYLSTTSGNGQELSLTSTGTGSVEFYQLTCDTLNVRFVKHAQQFSIPSCACVAQCAANTYVVLEQL